MAWSGAVVGDSVAAPDVVGAAVIAVKVGSIAAGTAEGVRVKVASATGMISVETGEGARVSVAFGAATISVGAGAAVIPTHPRRMITARVTVTFVLNN